MTDPRATEKRRALAILLLALCPIALAASIPTRSDDEQRQPIEWRGPETEVGPTCVTSGCHEDVPQGNFVHGPTAVGVCDACHKPARPGKHDFEPPDGTPSACYFCHEPFEDKGHLHGPVAGGMCTACHDPHHAEYPALLKANPNGDLCYTCHEREQVLVGDHLHAPVVSGACLECHDPHTADNPMMLQRAGNDLCFSCHTETHERLAGLPAWHEPVKQDCLQCHDPHASTAARQLRDPVPELCWKCHEPTHVEIEEASRVHEAIAMDRQCMNCHDPHASGHEKLLPGTTKDACMKCHGEPVEMPDGKTLMAMGDVLKTGYLHGPVQQGDCAACHKPHAGDQFRLLTDPYPERFYAPFDLDEYALCFRCHDKDLVLDEETETLTGFRDGARNLHYLHVHKEKKGRTCRACHEVHGSDHPFHIRDSVPFGNWAIPLNYEKLQDGGRCSPGCHQTKEYHRGP